ncbi:hypothetical protein KAR10_02225 [bacterium]|nr:hypothetical protein [bacterium]
MGKVLLALCTLVLLVSVALAKDVNVIMKNGEMITGQLIGINSGVIYLKDRAGKVDQIKTDTVASVFDAGTGAKIDAGIKAPAEAASIKNKENIPAPNSNAQSKKKMLFVFGALHSGLVTHVPCKPLEGPYVPGSAYMIAAQPYDNAWGAGLGIELKLDEFFAVSLDGGISRWEKLLAKENGYAVGDWVWEQSGYTDARIGPFPRDVKYYMDTTMMRLGGKYFAMGGTFQPWIGASLGIYAWQAIIGNREQEVKYSEISSDISFSPALQVGMDFVFDEFAIRIFSDYGTAAVNPYFENLFRDGWTFETLGGEHVEGVLKFGIALGIAM